MNEDATYCFVGFFSLEFNMIEKVKQIAGLIDCILDTNLEGEENLGKLVTVWVDGRKVWTIVVL